MSVSNALVWASEELHRSENPRLDAEVLLRKVCGYSHAQLISHSSDLLSGSQWQHYRHLVDERINGKPIAYLTGTREFWSLAMEVTPDTLIPRPETELLVEQALAIIPTDQAWTIADLGTGSGAIAIAIAKERPLSIVIAVDNSLPALGIARKNAVTHNAGNIRFCATDWLSTFSGNHFDLIISNPPYIKIGDLHLSQGDLRFEPTSALTSGDDGLMDIRVIADSAKYSLKAAGYLLLEHGFDQQQAVKKILSEDNYQNIHCVRDLAGNNRVTFCQTGRDSVSGIML
ncbi:MAG: peptide chain release factor N(5)-glutamine methyltransferase [Gammaproteobacteria bacterium]|nr:peptide chain release factor N(5)-glutamine methyltransferase [Gammaproteobacteria bacterium]